MTVVHSDMHTHEQFLKMSVGLGLGLVFLCLCLALHFVHFFSFSLEYFVLVLFAFVVLGFCVTFSFFSTMPRDWLGRTSPK